MKLNEGPSAGYRDLVIKGQLIEDHFQLIAVNELERLHDLLQGYEISHASGSVSYTHLTLPTTPYV